MTVVNPAPIQGGVIPAGGIPSPASCGLGAVGVLCRGPPGAVQVPGETEISPSYRLTVRAEAAPPGDHSPG
jgi:hypothetical protein